MWRWEACLQDWAHGGGGACLMCLGDATFLFEKDGSHESLSRTTDSGGRAGLCVLDNVLLSRLSAALVLNPLPAARYVF